MVSRRGSPYHFANIEMYSFMTLWALTDCLPLENMCSVIYSKWFVCSLRLLRFFPNHATGKGKASGTFSMKNINKTLQLLWFGRTIIFGGRVCGMHTRTCLSSIYCYYYFYGFSCPRHDKVGEIILHCSLYWYWQGHLLGGYPWQLITPDLTGQCMEAERLACYDGLFCCIKVCCSQQSSSQQFCKSLPNAWRGKEGGD